MIMRFKGSVLRNRFNSKEEKSVELTKEEKLMKRFQCRGLKDFFENSYHNNYSFENLIKFLYRPTCSSSVGVVRALFGLMMVIDIPDERGLWNIAFKFGDPMRCHFPLLEWVSPLPVEYMGLLYGIMWLGALGIFIGFHFHFACIMFILPYWYIYLLDKSAWNNHSYLFGLIASLFTFTQANHSFSVDAIIKPQIKNKPVPLWNYIIIRFQFFLLYFYAGVKKFDPDWIGGYSMLSLGLHWVFNPFRLFLNNDQIDFWIIHIFGFVFDLTVGFFLLIDKTRAVAMLFSTAFHLMNSCMFHIGQFPYVCLVTTPIFCHFDWPDRLRKYIKHVARVFQGPSQKEEKFETSEKMNAELIKITTKHKLTCCCLALYMGIQLFLPYSHFITQGYNNWTNGLYGYSWDMMVQNWYTNIIVIKVIDNQSKEEYFLDPEAWVDNTRYSRHGDMLVQYAHCLKKNLNNPISGRFYDMRKSSFKNISIYADIWYSLNGRFQQRMFDPRKDLLKVEWNPFNKIKWLMPLLSELSSWRKDMAEIEKQVFRWSDYSDVIFVADFPGLHLENYIASDISNVTLTVLQGVVVLEQYAESIGAETFNITLFKGDSAKIKEGTFHKLYTVSEEPSCYMYTYDNYSLNKLDIDAGDESNGYSLPIETVFKNNLKIRIDKFWKSLYVLEACFKKLVFNTPISFENY